MEGDASSTDDEDLDNISRRQKLRSDHNLLQGTTATRDDMA